MPTPSKALPAVEQRMSSKLDEDVIRTHSVTSAGATSAPPTAAATDVLIRAMRDRPARNSSSFRRYSS